MSKDYNREIFAKIKKIFDDDEVLYGADTEEGNFFFPFFDHAISGISAVSVLIKCAKESFSVQVMLPLKGDCKDPAQMARLYEASARINFGVKIAHMQIGPEGDMRFCSFVDAEGMENSVPTTDQVKNAVFICMNTALRYGPVITAALYDAAADLQQIVDACEHKATISHREILHALIDARTSGHELPDSIREAIEVLFENTGDPGADDDDIDFSIDDVDFDELDDPSNH